METGTAAARGRYSVVIGAAVPAINKMPDKAAAKKKELPFDIVSAAPPGRGGFAFPVKDHKDCCGHLYVLVKVLLRRK